MPSPYEVDPGRLRAIFERRIVPMLFHGITPASADQGGAVTLVLLGGQTAAGKSSALRGVAARHGPDLVLLNPDDFRLLHPELDQIMRDAPHEMTDHTAQAMYAWSDMARAHAHAHGYRLVIENTFSRPEYLTGYTDELSRPVYTTGPDGTRARVHDGYDVEVVALATPPARSCLDMVGRYLGEPSDQARWSDADYHDAVVDQIPRSLEVLEGDPNVDRIIVTDRDGTLHYDNTRGPDGTWRSPPRAAHALRQARGDGRVIFDQDEARGWMATYWNHGRALIERGELDARTAPTMLALHTHADQVAVVAYAGQDDQLARHHRWQKVQKAVFLAGQRGVDNTVLPAGAEAFFAASPARRREHVEAMRTAVGAEGAIPEDAAQAVRRAQQGMAPPTLTRPSSQGPEAAPGRREVGREGGLER